jgi:uncharacterized protein involved in exopolysaccharide biosynthesis
MAQDIVAVPPRSFYPPQGSYYPIRPPEETVGWKATKQFFFVLFKWKRMILSFLFVFTVAALAAAYLKPPVRAATAKIMLKGDRTPLMISGLTPLSSRFAFSPQIMQTEIEMMRSREVLFPVAKKILSETGREKETLNVDATDGVMGALSANTVATAIPETNIIQVTHFAQTSEDAERNLRRIVDQYLDRQAEIQSGSGKLLKFYEQEKERVGASLLQAEEQLNNWQEKNKTLSIDKQIHDQLGMLADSEKALAQTEAEIEPAKSRIGFLTGQLNAIPERLVMSREQVRNPAATKLQTDLSVAEVALTDLLLRYTEKDRRVQEKREQIAILKKQLTEADQQEVIGKEITGLNPIREGLMKELASTRSLLGSLITKREILRKQLGDVAASLPALREKQLEIERRSRVVGFHKEAYQLYGKKLEEARIATGIGKEQLGHIAVIEVPHAVAFTGDFQKRIGLVILAAFVGLALGMAIAFGLEFFNNTLRTQEDAEHYLGLPVLTAIPDLRDRPVALLS